MDVIFLRYFMFAFHLEPLELVLRSNGSSGIFYCRSKTEGQRPLTASIDNSAKTSPTFLMRTEQINSTTLRIRIQPNGYIGINRINCHWIDNHTYPQTADLVIGGMKFENDRSNGLIFAL